MSNKLYNGPRGLAAPGANAHAPRYFDLLCTAFVALLLLSNIAATKLIEIDTPLLPLIFDGGAILFPFTYIIGDLLTEVYGFRRAKRVILTGFAFSILAAVVFWLVQISPSAPGYHNQKAFEAVLGFVPRIVAASIAGYLIGQFLNSVVLAWLKEWLGERNMWVRLVGSTIVGEAADTVTFCTIAFYGIITGAEFVNYTVVGFVYKVGVEVVFLPLTYLVIGWVKRAEPAYVSIDVERAQEK